MEVRGGKANRAPADEMRKFRIVRTFIEVAHYLSGRLSGSRPINRKGMATTNSQLYTPNFSGKAVCGRLEKRRMDAYSSAVSDFLNHAIPDKKHRTCRYS